MELPFDKLRIVRKRKSTAFTLVELLVVVSIIGLTLAALLPALGSFFSGARLPDARNLMSAYLVGARNYAVANKVGTALVFTEDTSESKRRVLMYLTKYDSTDSTFKVVPGRETRYLPDEIMISDSNSKSDTESPVVICFSSAGQLSAGRSVTISTVPTGSQDVSTVNSQTELYLYDSSAGDDPERVQINYYTGVVIEQ